MVFEQIENLKQRFTDKYVVVDESRPELRRFRGYTGLVKTVNMSGRALVQFEEFENNIGWFDIDLDFLKVVDRPPPKEEKPARAAPAKPTAKDKATAAKVEAAPQGAKAPAAGMAVQDILAAARGKPGGAPAAAPKETAPKAPAAKPAAAAGPTSVADILAAARGEKAGGAKPAPAQTEAKKPEAKASIKMEAPLAKDPSQMSVAEILAAARGKAAAPAAAPAKAGAAVEAAASAPEPPPPPAAVTPAAAPKESEPVGELPTNTADIIAWCRRRDSKS
jgi:hypothetical protein